MKEKEIYYYPAYVPKQMLIKGLYIHEVIVMTLIFFMGLVLFKIPGLIIALMIDSVAYMLFVRTNDTRRNLISIMSDYMHFILGNQIIFSKPRGAVEASKKKKKRKWSKRKRQYFQDHFPFEYIDDGKIKMENEKIYLYFKINANNINLFSEGDLIMLHTDLCNQLDQLDIDKFKLRFIIQDAVFNIENNVQVLEKNRQTSSIPFIIKMMDKLIVFMRKLKEKTTKKAFYLRIVLIDDDEREITNIQNRIMTLFKSTLELTIPDRIELKQMIAIFGNRIFADDYPDTELPVEDNEEEILLIKKEKKYENRQLPGIYEFKDMIVPITGKFYSDYGVIGSNFIKSYAVKSFLGSTSDHNLLSDISAIKGITTSIYIEALSTEKFKTYLKGDVKSKRSNIGDELDMLDAQQEMDNSLSSYKQLRFSRNKIYYISTYFMLSASTQKELKDLDEKFKTKVGDRGITLDYLQLKQEKAYHCCNPVGENELGEYVKQNIPSKSTANLYPFNEPSLLDKYGSYIGTINNSKLPVLFDLFQKHGSNKNILISGLSGVGKTVLMMLLMESSLYQGAYLRNIDVEGTYSKFIEKLGGIDINLSGNNEYAINVLQIRLPDEVQKGLVEDYISEVRYWVATYKSEWNERKLDLFERYLTKVYKDFGINNETDLRQLKPKDYPIIEDVYKAIEKDLNENEGLNANFREEMEDMLLGLESAVKGADAKVFNRHTYLGDVDDLKAINFNMKDLMAAAKNKKMAQWLNVFTYISQFVNKNNTLANKIVVGFDELSEILKEIYINLLYTVSSYERRFRKYGAIFLKCTQQLDDVYVASENMKTLITPLLSQSSIKFIFHLGETDYSMVKKLLLLKDVELEKIKEKREHKCLMRVGQYSYDLDVFMPEWYKIVKPDA